LADKVNWLIDRARPAGRGPYTNAELAALIELITGEQVSHTWGCRKPHRAVTRSPTHDDTADRFGSLSI
jgi:hypothetical protein